MSPDNGQKRKQGFASLSPERLKEVSARGGSRRVPTKGFGSLPPEKRKEMSSKASKEYWRRVKEVRQNGTIQHSEIQRQEDRDLSK